MKKLYLTDIREFFWPLLEPYDIPPKAKTITTENIEAVDDQNLKTAFELTLKNYDGENERKNNVESKSIIFIGSTGLIVTILLTITKDFLFNKDFDGNLVSHVFLFMVVGFVVYLTRTLWFSIKCLERRGYHSINKSLYERNDKFFLKEIITEITNMNMANSIVINEKVDYMVMAQEYFKRAIITTSLYPLLIIFKNLPGDYLSYKKLGNCLQSLLSSVETYYNFLLIIFLFTVFLNGLIIVIFFLDEPPRVQQ